MSHLPAIISDLALILMCAGLVTLIFKRLGQPLVLGYIVAGFLAGPHFSFTPTVADTGSIQTWADIGVIFLMFTLGLEFSFKKIFRMGAGPIIAACAVMFCMMSLGSIVGHLFGWSSMDSLFLGGMLAMSSTTIIYKAFDDLGMRQQKFSGEVLSVLILEDILGILLMVVLSAMAASRNFEGQDLLFSLLKLLFFLILWFIVGVFLVPYFLKKSARWMTGETLLVVTLGLCFALVVMASKAGYSSAFGAFMMGSILAETVEAESIERVVGPVKDLFGAIFFVSVGMLVDPAVLTEYALPIALISLTVIVGQMVFGTGSFILAGHSLKVAMQCGFSLAQIGEFAFIIATLGISLHVTSDFLYPVVVAVSVLTTFLTPYMIRAAQPAYGIIVRFIPAPVRRRLDDRGHHAVASASPWRSLLTALVMQVSIYLTLSIATTFIILGALLPFLRWLLTPAVAGVVCALLTIAVVSPFLRAIVMRKNHSEEWQTISRRGRLPHGVLMATFVVRYLIAAALVFYLVHSLSPLQAPWAIFVHAALALLMVAGMVASRRIKWASIRLERNFVQNLRLREVAAERQQARPGYARRLPAHNLHMARLRLPDGSRMAGHTLRQLDFGRRDGVLVAAIIRGESRINIPGGNVEVYPGDYIEAIGDDDSLATLEKRISGDVQAMAVNNAEHYLTLRRIVITDDFPLCRHRLIESGLRDTYHCMAVGFEGSDGNIDTAEASRTIMPGDILWVVGEEDDVALLLRMNRTQAI